MGSTGSALTGGTMTRYLGIVAMLLFFASSFAEASAILLGDRRVVFGEARATSNDDGDLEFDRLEPSSEFAPFNETATFQATVGDTGSQGIASQNSSVTTSLITGSGEMDYSAFLAGQAEVERATAHAASNFDIGFILTTPHTFDFSGLMSIEASLRGSEADGFLGLIGPVGFGFQLFAVPGSLTSLPVTQSGRLTPGSYVLFAGFRGSANTDSSLGLSTSSGGGDWAFEFRLNEITGVPEPTSLWLLAPVVSGALFRKRLSSNPARFPFVGTTNSRSAALKESRGRSFLVTRWMK